VTDGISAPFRVDRLGLAWYAVVYISPSEGGSDQVNGARGVRRLPMNNRGERYSIGIDTQPPTSPIASRREAAHPGGRLRLGSAELHLGLRVSRGYGGRRYRHGTACGSGTRWSMIGGP
jgi:hypothetical protein